MQPHDWLVGIYTVVNARIFLIGRREIIELCASREIHYVCDSGRVEGLILDKDEQEEEETRTSRGESVKGMVS
jgi:hypothetical protein